MLPLVPAELGQKTRAAAISHRGRTFLLAAILTFYFLLTNSRTIELLNNYQRELAKVKQIQMDENQTIRCIRGPYVWDMSDHKEGIGSTFQHRKYGLILADALGAKWVGTLLNWHDSKPRVNHAGSIFGLGDDSCDEEELRKRFNSHDKYLDFLVVSTYPRATPPVSPPFRKPSLCGVIESGNQTALRALRNITNRTVIVLNGDRLDEQWNYCTFNEHFRRRFRRAQISRNAKTRPENETWITVHFRWGDVASEDVDAPNKRNGIGLSSLSEVVEKYWNESSKENHDGAVKLHFISEGKVETFRKFLDILPWTKMHLNISWQEALDIMSQSNVLVGGRSSFFVLGAHLCENCTVVTRRKRNEKFFSHPEEEVLARHHKLDTAWR